MPMADAPYRGAIQTTVAAISSHLPHPTRARELLPRVHHQIDTRWQESASARQRMSDERWPLANCERLGMTPCRCNKKPRELALPGFCDKSLAVTYFHMRRPHTIIGAEQFHFRVRDGIGWFPLAIAARQTVWKSGVRFNFSSVVMNSNHDKKN